MGKFITLLFFIFLSFEGLSQVPSVKGQDDTSKMYPVNYEVPGKSAIKLNSTTVLLDTDKDNLLVNGSFEHQTATQGWSLTSLASSTASTSDVFDGKKKVCLSGVGSIFQMLSDTDKYHGRKFVARFNIQNPQGREGRACIYDGEDLHKCVQIRESDEFVEYTIFDTFINGNSYGVIVNSLELDGICVDAVSVKLDQTRVIQVGVQGFSKKDAYSPAFRKVNATSISVKEGTSITVGETNVTYSVETPVILPTLTPGTDYAIYACADGSIRASDNWSAPPGYDTTNSRKVGGFHYGLVSPTEAVASGGFATSGNGMIWTQSDVDRIKGINEFSIWDIKFRPKANDPRGMALVANQFWVDIYFTNTNHEVNGTSKAGTDVASGTVLPKKPTMWGGDGTTTYASGSWWNFSDIAKAHGKRLMNFQEFAAAAFGVTEETSLGGSSVTINETKREPGFTSKWGLEQASGHHWTWGAEISGATGSATWTANTEGRGSTYAANIAAPLYGGDRAHGAASGSRASNWGHFPWGTYWSLGLRAACDHLILE